MALSVLDEIAAAHNDLSATEINSSLELPKSTLHRILNTLEVEEAVQRNPATRRFSLGPRVSRYGSKSRRSELVAHFMQLAESFVAEYDETIQLCTYANGVVTFVAFVESTQPVRLSCEVGRQRPAHATASGKVLLAFSGPEPQAAFFREHDPLVPMTDATITDQSTLAAQLETIREQGFATESQESALNLSCIAAPVFNREGAVSAAVTLCLASTRVTEQHVQRLRAPLLKLTEHMAAAR